jgi:hypothetical protein
MPFELILLTALLFIVTYGGPLPPNDLLSTAQRLFVRSGPRYGSPADAAAARRCAYPVVSGTTDKPNAGFRGVVITTIANMQAMGHLVPKLLEGLHSSALDKHTIVYGVDEKAGQACWVLNAQYHHICQVDRSLTAVVSAESRAIFGSLAYLSYGFVKTHHILNLLSAGVDVLYLDADVAVLANPLPAILALAADIAAPAQRSACSSGAWDQRAWSNASDIPYDTSVMYVRSRSSVLRCVHSTLFDLWSAATAGGSKDRIPNPTTASPGNSAGVWEADSFGRVIPNCTRLLRLKFRELPVTVGHHTLSPLTRLTCVRWMTCA